MGNSVSSDTRAASPFGGVWFGEWGGLQVTGVCHRTKNDNMQTQRAGPSNEEPSNPANSSWALENRPKCYGIVLLVLRKPLIGGLDSVVPI